MGAQPPIPTRTFDFTNVIVTWGPFTLNGGMENIKVARAEDAFTTHVGADGTVTRALNSNRLGTVEITYGQNSPVHDVLSAQAQLDEKAGTAIYPMEIVDANGRSIAKAPGAWIKKRADAEYQKEATTRMWTFECDQLEHFVGGLN